MMKFKLSAIFLVVVLLINCSNSKTRPQEESERLVSISGQTEIATLAGGCFWCVEAPFERYDGVIKAVSGYTGGSEVNPSYKEVSSGQTGHVEAVQIYFDPQIISYAEILDIYWKQFDPTDAGGSFADRGAQYESAIFYHSAKQKNVAEASRQRLDNSGKYDKKIVTPIKEFTSFYPAEDYHQDFYKKNPARYYSYKKGSGRSDFISWSW
jgi:peptide methionine sulfoxide reductase msrA/msrB